MPEFGLIGYPLHHSFSRKYFIAKFEREKLTGYSYHQFPIENIKLLHEILMDHPGLCGLNVTKPYKISVIPFLDSIDAMASETGAVNTIKVKTIDGKKILSGFNTDVFGFEHSLKHFIGDEKPLALILGTGGASKAVAYVLRKLNFSFLFVSRNPTNGTMISYEQVDSEILEKYHLIINSSPIGTFPETENCPDIPYKYLCDQHFLFDLVYNPEVSMFLSKGKSQGCKVNNGLEMLEIQANESFKIWESD